VEVPYGAGSGSPAGRNIAQGFGQHPDKPGREVSRRAGSLCAGRVVTASGALAGQPVGCADCATVWLGEVTSPGTGWPGRYQAGFPQGEPLP